MSRYFVSIYFLTGLLLSGCGRAPSAPLPTTTPIAPAAPVSVAPTHAHAANVGRCGEAMDTWHPPVVAGCATGHEHGDAPPEWVQQSRWPVSFHGHFNTSPQENVEKHAAMKGFATTLKDVELYLRIHAASNPLDRSARFHSYELWAHDKQGGISHWQGWYDVGDAATSRFPRREGDETDQRPAILVVDRRSFEDGIRCEQWYAFTAEWSWDLGWTICDATTFYAPDELRYAYDLSQWPLTGGTGETRRLEAAWYADRPHPTGEFYATQFGELVNGPDDPRCSATSDKGGKPYPTICLAQFIAPTMTDVRFPGNSAEKKFDVTGVEIPN